MIVQAMLYGPQQHGTVCGEYNLNEKGMSVGSTGVTSSCWQLAARLLLAAIQRWPKKGTFTHGDRLVSCLSTTQCTAQPTGQ